MSRVYIPVELRNRVQEHGRRQCAYCQTQESIIGTPMEVDHIIPRADGGPTVEGNLCLACSPCNDHKNARREARDPETEEIVVLFHPRQQVWSDHFCWNEAGDEIVGLTPTGRATIIALNLNRNGVVRSRRLWAGAGWHPPKDEPAQS